MSWSPINKQDLATLMNNGWSYREYGGSSGGGGGVVAVSPKEVNFYDYDGTCVYAYTVKEALKLSELPAGPEHPGLVFQGWNWSLEGVKGLTRAMNIGAMYTTDDGTTRLYITLQEGRTSPMLGVGVNGTVTVDWGDGTEPDVLTGTSIITTKWTPNHAYAKPGDYVIRLTVAGEAAFTGTTSENQGATILRYATGTDERNNVYVYALKKVEIGDGLIKIDSYAFNYCYALQSVTIPDSVIDVDVGAFTRCYALQSVTIPDGITDIKANTFKYCYALQSVSIPDGVMYIRGSAFESCYTLQSVTIPDSVTTFESSAFAYCYTLQSVTIPDSVTSISASAFSRCYGLAGVTVKSGALTIESSAFTRCSGVAYYDFTACDAVPTLSSANAFNNIPADCEIRVPAALYDEWIAATNWATYAGQIKAY